MLTPAKILKFGDTRLRQVADTVDIISGGLKAQVELLQSTLLDFQQRVGWGRSIAAPQIGILKRFIAINSPGLPEVMINPEITWHSEDKQQIWDDCMSLPEIAVLVERWMSVSVRYQCLEGNWHELVELSAQDSELLQHEFDHLDGVVMVDRMIEKGRIISRELVDSQ